VVPAKQLTTEQCETIEQLEKEMSYAQLYNNIEELLYTEPSTYYSEEDVISCNN